MTNREKLILLEDMLKLLLAQIDWYPRMHKYGTPIDTLSQCYTVHVISRHQLWIYLDELTKQKRTMPCQKLYASRSPSASDVRSRKVA